MSTPSFYALEEEANMPLTFKHKCTEYFSESQPTKENKRLKTTLAESDDLDKE